MEEKILVDIINLCLALDTKTSLTYSEISGLSENSELKQFWENMAKEEEEHIEFWQKLLKLAKKGLLPQLFQNGEKIKAELEEIAEKVGTLIETAKSTRNISDAFLIAFQLEFFLLHPAFETLFHFIKIFDTQVNPEDVYERHLNEFIEAFNKYGTVTPELGLLGEALQRLWRENKALALQSSLDELTGILNRRGFFNILKPLSHLAQRSNLNIAIVMIDIDHFKKINDTYGHSRGDEVLMKIANILKNNIRTSDIVARYGGEEFIIYLSSVDPNSTYNIAEKIRKRVEEETKDDIPVTISGGLSYGPLTKKVEEEIVDYINKADACLYEAKGSGRNKICGL